MSWTGKASFCRMKLTLFFDVLQANVSAITSKTWMTVHIKFPPLREDMVTTTMNPRTCTIVTVHIGEENSRHME